MLVKAPSDICSKDAISKVSKITQVTDGLEFGRRHKSGRHTRYREIMITGFVFRLSHAGKIKKDANNRLQHFDLRIVALWL